MENASKALIMAGGILIALMIIGAILLMYNNLTAYQKTSVESKREIQTVEFNQQFATYERNNVRGSDLLSLVNRIIDYNSRKTEEGYTEIKIDIQIGDKELIKDKFCYDLDSDPKLIKSSYNEKNLERNLVSIVKNIEEKYNGTGSTNYISNLISNVSQVMDHEESAKKILPQDLSKYGGYSKIRQDVATYYEYSQLKKAYFDCTQTKYDKYTGRIVYMNFEFNKDKNFE